MFRFVQSLARSEGTAAAVKAHRTSADGQTVANGASATQTTSMRQQSGQNSSDEAILPSVPQRSESPGIFPYENTVSPTFSQTLKNMDKDKGRGLSWLPNDQSPLTSSCGSAGELSPVMSEDAAAATSLVKCNQTDLIISKCRKHNTPTEGQLPVGNHDDNVYFATTEQNSTAVHHIGNILSAPEAFDHNIQNPAPVTLKLPGIKLNGGKVANSVPTTLLNDAELSHKEVLDSIVGSNLERVDPKQELYWPKKSTSKGSERKKIVPKTIKSKKMNLKIPKIMEDTIHGRLQDASQSFTPRVAKLYSKKSSEIAKKGACSNPTLMYIPTATKLRREEPPESDKREACSNLTLISYANTPGVMERKITQKVAKKRVGKRETVRYPQQMKFDKGKRLDKSQIHTSSIDASVSEKINLKKSTNTNSQSGKSEKNSSIVKYLIKGNSLSHKLKPLGNNQPSRLKAKATNQQKKLMKSYSKKEEQPPAVTQFKQAKKKVYEKNTLKKASNQAKDAKKENSKTSEKLKKIPTPLNSANKLDIMERKDLPGEISGSGVAGSSKIEQNQSPKAESMQISYMYSTENETKPEERFIVLNQTFAINTTIRRETGEKSLHEHKESNVSQEMLSNPSMLTDQVNEKHALNAKDDTKSISSNEMVMLRKKNRKKDRKIAEALNILELEDKRKKAKSDVAKLQPSVSSRKLISVQGKKIKSDQSKKSKERSSSSSSSNEEQQIPLTKEQVRKVIKVMQLLAVKEGQNVSEADIERAVEALATNDIQELIKKETMKKAKLKENIMKGNGSDDPSSRSSQIQPSSKKTNNKMAKEEIGKRLRILKDSKLTNEKKVNNVAVVNTTSNRALTVVPADGNHRETTSRQKTTKLAEKDTGSLKSPLGRLTKAFKQVSEKSTFKAKKGAKPHSRTSPQATKQKVAKTLRDTDCQVISASEIRSVRNAIEIALGDMGRGREFQVAYDISDQAFKLRPADTSQSMFKSAESILTKLNSLKKREEKTDRKLKELRQISTEIKKQTDLPESVKNKRPNKLPPVMTKNKSKTIKSPIVKSTASEVYITGKISDRMSNSGGQHGNYTDYLLGINKIPNTHQVRLTRPGERKHEQVGGAKENMADKTDTWTQVIKLLYGNKPT